MRLRKLELITAISFIAGLASFGAVSEDFFQEMPADENAFGTQWSGEYYSEEQEEQPDSLRSFQARRAHSLKIDSTETVETEEFEEDENGKWIPLKKVSPSPIQEEIPEVSFSARQSSGSTASHTHSPYPVVSPSPSPSPIFPYFIQNRSDAYVGPWMNQILPESLRSENQSGTSQKSPDTGPQAFYYYNSGYLRNATRLENEGRGFVKVFQDRDESRGGRGWGTRAMIDAIYKVSAEFAEKFPGRERIQVADIAAKNGGMIGHGSHKNGLDADIIFMRKLKHRRKEQPIAGAFGKNGFAEQFVISGPATYRTYRDSRGRKRVKKTYTRKLSENFDVEANFELLKMFDRLADVKVFFIDQELRRALDRYAEQKGLTDDPATLSMLNKLDHEPSHADHFHVRLNCQDGDSRCVSANGRMPSPKKPAAKKPVKKKVVAKSAPAKRK